MRLTCWEAAVVGLQVFKDARQGSEVRTTFVLSSHTLLPSHLQETQKDNTKQIKYSFTFSDCQRLLSFNIYILSVVQ